LIRVTSSPAPLIAEESIYENRSIHPLALNYRIRSSLRSADIDLVSAQSSASGPNNAVVSLVHNPSIPHNTSAQSSASGPNNAVVSLEHNPSIRPNTPAQSSASGPNNAVVSLVHNPSIPHNTSAQSSASGPNNAVVSLEHNPSIRPNTPAQSSASGPNNAVVSLVHNPLTPRHPTIPRNGRLILDRQRPRWVSGSIGSSILDRQRPRLVSGSIGSSVELVDMNLLTCERPSSESFMIDADISLYDTHSLPPGQSVAEQSGMIGADIAIGRSGPLSYSLLIDIEKQNCSEPPSTEPQYAPYYPIEAESFNSSDLEWEHEEYNNINNI